MLWVGDMTKENAPQGATHYSIYSVPDTELRYGYEVVTYYKIMGGSWVRVLSGGSLLCCNNRNLPEIKPL